MGKNSGLILFLIGFVFPGALCYLFIFITTKKYNLIDIGLRYRAKSYGFPDDIWDLSNFLSILYVGKTFIYYILFFACVLCVFIFPKAFNVVFGISSAVLFLLCGVQFLALHYCKLAHRKLNTHDMLLFSPLRSIYRLALIYAVLIFTAFNLFWDALFVFLGDLL